MISVSSIQHLATQKAYELQVSNLTRSLANMEDSLRQLQEEKQSVMQDLAAVRELCVKLDATKESLSRQLTAKNIDHEQVSDLILLQIRQVIKQSPLSHLSPRWHENSHQIWCMPSGRQHGTFSLPPSLISSALT